MIFRAVFDTSNDGFTGNVQDIDCWACGLPMISKEYILNGGHMWTTIHNTPGCRDLALKKCEGYAGRVAPMFKVTKKKKAKDSSSARPVQADP